MRKMITAIGLAAVATLAGCSASDVPSTPVALTEKQSKLLAKELDGKTPGKPVNCISLAQGNSTIRVSDDMLLYRVSGRLVYQNRLKASCPGLSRDDDVMVVDQYGSQQCRGDIIRLVDRYSGIPGGFCVLGDFVPYRKDDKVAAE